MSVGSIVQEIETDWDYHPPHRRADRLHRLYRDTRRLLELELLSQEVDRVGRLLDILDIGCGDPTQSTSYHARIRSLVRVYLGIEPSLPIISRVNLLPMVGIVRANGELCCVRNNAVDVALCFSALDHCVEPDRVLANMASALRPGGCALIDLRNCNAWHKMVFRWLPACMTQRLRLAEDSHDWHFSPRDLARRLEAVGFHEIQLYDIFYLDIFCRLLPGRVLDWGLSLLGEQLCTAALRVADRLCHFIAPHCGGNFIALARKLN